MILSASKIDLTKIGSDYRIFVDISGLIARGAERFFLRTLPSYLTKHNNKVIVPYRLIEYVNSIITGKDNELKTKGTAAKKIIDEMLKIDILQIRHDESDPPLELIYKIIFERHSSEYNLCLITQDDYLSQALLSLKTEDADLGKQAHEICVAAVNEGGDNLLLWQLPAIHHEDEAKGSELECSQGIDEFIMDAKHAESNLSIESDDNRRNLEDFEEQHDQLQAYTQLLKDAHKLKNKYFRLVEKEKAIDNLKKELLSKKRLLKEKMKDAEFEFPFNGDGFLAQIFKTKDLSWLSESQEILSDIQSDAVAIQEALMNLDYPDTALFERGLIIKNKLNYLYQFYETRDIFWLKDISSLRNRVKILMEFISDWEVDETN